MNAFSIQAAQGDLLIRRIDAIPADAVRRDPVDGRHVVAHSETGHHHVVDADVVEAYESPASELIGYLNALSEAQVTHLRPYDTHAPIMLTPGAYEIRRQREYVSEGWRRAAD